jgi:hypothetical protein
MCPRVFRVRRELDSGRAPQEMSPPGGKRARQKCSAACECGAGAQQQCRAVYKCGKRARQKCKAACECGTGAQQKCRAVYKCGKRARYDDAAVIKIFLIKGPAETREQVVREYRGRIRPRDPPSQGPAHQLADGPGPARPLRPIPKPAAPCPMS